MGIKFDGGREFTGGDRGGRGGEGGSGGRGMSKFLAGGLYSSHPPSRENPEIWVTL